MLRSVVEYAMKLSYNDSFVAQKIPPYMACYDASSPRALLVSARASVLALVLLFWLDREVLRHVVL